MNESPREGVFCFESGVSFGYDTGRKPKKRGMPVQKLSISTRGQAQGQYAEGNPNNVSVTWTASRWDYALLRDT
jgi:hypothetical protein